MNYRSVCSGIEAATVAWEPLGFRALSFSEIEPFPCSVLSHRFPDVPNLGDMTKYHGWPNDEATDVLVGGTPCQSFSVAGLRKGLADPRGNLALVFLGLVDRYRPTWFVWENVPGVLSSDGGRCFGSFLGAVAQLGYGFAYRVLDAQFFGVPQRRRRVFVVGHIGDWRTAAAVLFESEGLRGDFKKGGKKREDTAGTISSRTTGGGGLGTDFELGGGLVAGTVRANHGNIDAQQAWTNQPVTHTLRGNGFDASEDGTGRGTPLVPTSFDCKAGGNTSFSVSDKPGSLRGIGHGGGHSAVAFAQNQLGEVRASPIAGTVNTNSNASGRNTPMAMQGMQVRRLTPRECERLQGFPDDWTLVPHRKKPAADGPRYKAIGNSMAVPVMRWIGRRIDEISKQ